MRISLHHRRDRGQSLVEFSLIFPIAMLLFMALFDFGRAVYGLNAVGNAAREGTRTAIVNQNWSDIRQRASDQATGLGIRRRGSVSASTARTGRSGAAPTCRQAAWPR